MRNTGLFLLFALTLFQGAWAQNVQEDQQTVAALQRLLADPNAGPAAYQVDGQWQVMWPDHRELEEGVRILLEANLASTEGGIVRLDSRTSATYILAANATLTNFARKQAGLSSLGNRTGQQREGGWTSALALAGLLLALALGIRYGVPKTHNAITRLSKYMNQRDKGATSQLDLPLQQACRERDELLIERNDLKKVINEITLERNTLKVQIPALEADKEQLQERVSALETELTERQGQIQLSGGADEKEEIDTGSADIEADPPLVTPPPAEELEHQGSLKKETPRIQKPLMGGSAESPRQGMTRKESLPVHQAPPTSTAKSSE